MKAIPEMVRYLGRSFDVLGDAVVDGREWLILFDPESGGLGLWVHADECEPVSS